MRHLWLVLMVLGISMLSFQSPINACSRPECIHRCGSVYGNHSLYCQHPVWFYNLKIEEMDTWAKLDRLIQQLYLQGWTIDVSDLGLSSMCLRVTTKVIILEIKI